MNLNLPFLPGSGGGTRVGLDIGFHSIKVVELIPHPSGFEILKFASKAIPSSSGQDRNRVIVDTIKEVFAESGIRNKGIYASVSGHNVVIRRTSLPKMPKEELAEAIKWNARDEVLFPMEGAALGWYVMGETLQEGTPYYQLLTVIARADILPGLVGIIKDAGLVPLGVTVIPLALWDYDRVLHPAEAGEITCYVDMGAERTRVYFVSEEGLLFSREIPNGGLNVTKALVGDYEADFDLVTLDDDQAEEIKIAHGLPSEDDDDTTEEGIPLREIRERVLPVVNRQLEEILRSIDYFKIQQKVPGVDRVLVAGGAGSLKGLHGYFVENLDIPVEFCNTLLQTENPVSGISQDDIDNKGAGLTTAAGLALGQCKKINVLPEEYRLSLKKSLIKMAPYAAALALAGILVSLSLDLRKNYQERRKILSVREAEMAQLQVQVNQGLIPIQQLRKLKEEKQTLIKERNQLPSPSRGSVNLPEVLEELSRLVPANASLERVDFSSYSQNRSEGMPGASLIIKGNVFGNESRVLDSLTEFLERLKSSPVFADVKLLDSKAVGTEKFTHSSIEFEITVRPIPRAEVQL